MRGGCVREGKGAAAASARTPPTPPWWTQRSYKPSPLPLPPLPPQVDLTKVHIEAGSKSSDAPGHGGGLLGP
jgi:hypothetical protein